MIDFIVNYWGHILIGLLFIAGSVIFAINERKNIKEWLLYAVIEAEKGLGSKTGKIKLRQVYDWFIGTYPIISKIVSFKTFSSLVDTALEEMKEILASNETIKQYVEGGTDNGLHA